MADVECDILIVGAGTGGCAAAMAATSLGMRVTMTDSGTMIGGQLTSQMVPPDEHRWIEEFGCTARYREYRNRVREIYGGKVMNPGGGWVSRLCHPPQDGLTVLHAMLERGISSGLLTIALNFVPSGAHVHDGSVEGVNFNTPFGERLIRAPQVLDATELGDLLQLVGAKYYRLGSESYQEFDEPHSLHDQEFENVQGFTWCFALGFDAQRGGLLARPARYDFWRENVPPGWPGPQLDFTFPNPVDRSPRTLPLLSSDPSDHATLFAYRQIVNGPDHARVTSVNWPQNDYFLGTVLDVPEELKASRLNEAKEQGFCLLYWMQNEAPRHDGGVGYPELAPRPDISLTLDGFAATPYFRESRRLVTRFTVTEQMVSAECNPGLDRAPAMPKSVGVGQYRIDLHPSANGRGYIDIDALPFQIPLGALIPDHLKNLLPACKNLGVTHITNGCYRLHPVEWNIGEAAGLLAANCVNRKVLPINVYETEALWVDFEKLLHDQGVETAWPDVPLTGR